MVSLPVLSKVEGSNHNGGFGAYPEPVLSLTKGRETRGWSKVLLNTIPPASLTTKRFVISFSFEKQVDFSPVGELWNIKSSMTATIIIKYGDDIHHICICMPP